MAKYPSVQVIEQEEGRKIAWTQSNYKLTFGDDELSLRCDKYQQDTAVQVGIYADKNRNLVVGTGEGLWKVAQIDIPAREYEEVEVEIEGETVVQKEAIALDMGDVVLSLWSIEGYFPNEE